MVLVIILTSLVIFVIYPSRSWSGRMASVIKCLDGWIRTMDKNNGRTMDKKNGTTEEQWIRTMEKQCQNISQIIQIFQEYEDKRRKDGFFTKVK